MAKNPADMTDKELDEAIANPPQEGLIPPVEVVVPAEKPDDKPKVKSKEEPEEKPVEELEKSKEEPEEPKTEVEEEKPPSRRETLRIQQVLQKLKEAQAPAPAPAAPTGQLDYSKELEADPEVIAKLEADRKAASDATYQQGLTQSNSIRFHTRLEMDAPKMEEKYPWLDKNSKEFKPALAQSVNEMYLSAVGFDQQTDTVKNPNIRYSDYVESIAELANEIAGDKTETSTKQIAKQAANTALRPDGSTVKRLNLNKLPEQMTNEELDARIALAIPQN